jgi:two-component system sensor histidine kinase NreB
MSHGTAQAQCVSVLVHSADGRLSVTAADDGVEFKPENEGAKPGKGIGLRGMREQAELIDDVLGIESAPGAGTVII